MSDSILFMAADFEAPKFIAGYHSSSAIQRRINKHFAYSFLIAKSVIIPAGCYYESNYTTKLVDTYHRLFLPYRGENPVAGLAIGDDRDSFAEDVEIKASWFPAPYGFSDTSRTSTLSARIEDLEPFIRRGKMRTQLTKNVLRDIDTNGKSFQIIKGVDDSTEITKEIVRPLRIIVQEQKYALLPPYIQIEMDRQQIPSSYKKMQKQWLDFVLFKNYMVSCEIVYDTYCNNPLSTLYGELFKSLYSFHVDYRDTMLFELFLELFPLRVLKNVESYPPERLLQIKYSSQFINYLECYKTVVKRIQDSLKSYILDQHYMQVKPMLDQERRDEQMEFERRIAVENTRDAESLYRSFHRIFHSPSHVREFQRWLSVRNMDLPLIRIMEFLDDNKDGVMASYIRELYYITRNAHVERKRNMKKNRISSLIAIGNSQSIDSGNTIYANSSPTVHSETVPADSIHLSDTSKCSMESKYEIKTSGFRFAVALSFPGEYRSFVEKIAIELGGYFGKEKVLYDKFFEAEFSRIDLDIYLQDLYSNHSKLIVVFLCAEYNEKAWCGVEWRAIRKLLNERRTMDRIMLVKLGAGGVDGISGIVSGWLTVAGKTAVEVANEIKNRYDMLP